MTSQGGTILVVDDEPMVAEVVATYLRRDGFSVDVVRDGRSALKRLDESAPSLVVLDIMLPGVDGREILSRIRKDGNTPVILLTALGEEADRIVGLELGADDYVTKPFSPRELAARVRSVLRRSNLEPDGSREHRVLAFDGLEIDQTRRTVTVAGLGVDTTRKEFDLLAFLAAAPGQVYTRAQLLEQVWDSSPDWQDPATVRVHIGQLRRKIEVDPTNPQRLLTVWGVGYRFEA
jgi:DNA-binding response OmpR family regulator